MLRLSGQARRLATIADVAAVHVPGGQRQLADKARHAGGHIGQRPKGHHRGQAIAGVDGVAIDVFKGVVARIGHGHQLDHAIF